MASFGIASVDSIFRCGDRLSGVCRTDHDREFDNEVQFGEFCNANGITHNFSALRTPQSNGIVERKNRTLQEMSRTILNERSLLQKFWCNAIDTSTYILNRILIRAILRKTPYELLRGYSQNSKAYIILNKHTRKVEESLNVTFDKTPPPSKTSPLVDDDLDEKEAIKVTEKKNLENDIVDETLKIDEIVNIKESRNHPLENVKGNLNQRTLRLVNQGYNQQEGIDYDETYAPVARLESIRILLAYVCALDFRLFQMDVKNTFLNSFINKEVYVAQPPGFIDFEKPDHVYKLRKALYGLKQAPKACFFKCLPFELPEDVVNKTLQIILELQFFKLSLFDLCCHNSSKTFQQPFISAIKSYSFRLFSSLPVSHLLWSSQSFGHQKGACPWLTENHFNSQYMKHWASQSFGT
ncbi:retrovirus-related pol polyprotein from transposon TNT 1-94 [Tanacetum coccineum]